MNAVNAMREEQADAAKLNFLADWLDAQDDLIGYEDRIVQSDLRRIAAYLAVLNAPVAS